MISAVEVAAISCASIDQASPLRLADRLFPPSQVVGYGTGAVGVTRETAPAVIGTDFGCDDPWAIGPPTRTITPESSAEVGELTAMLPDTQVDISDGVRCCARPVWARARDFEGIPAGRSG